MARSQHRRRLPVVLVLLLALAAASSCEARSFSADAVLPGAPVRHLLQRGRGRGRGADDDAANSTAANSTATNTTADGTPAAVADDSAPATGAAAAPADAPAAGTTSPAATPGRPTRGNNATPVRPTRGNAAPAAADDSADTASASDDSTNEDDTPTRRSPSPRPSRGNAAAVPAPAADDDNSTDTATAAGDNGNNAAGATGNQSATAAGGDDTTTPTRGSGNGANAPAAAAGGNDSVPAAAAGGDDSTPAASAGGNAGTGNTSAAPPAATPTATTTAAAASPGGAANVPASEAPKDAVQAARADEQTTQNLNNALGRSDVAATSNVLLNAGRGRRNNPGRVRAAASALTSSTGGSSRTRTVAAATVTAAIQDTAAVTEVLAAASAEAVSSNDLGRVRSFANVQTEALVEGNRRGRGSTVQTAVATASVQAATTNAASAAEVVAETLVTSGRRGRDNGARAFGFSQAQAFAVAQRRGQLGRWQETFAVAVARAAASDFGAAAEAIAFTADEAFRSGNGGAFARSQSQAFAVARSRLTLEPFARAVARAITIGGNNAARVYGQAFSQAIAAGGEQREALAVATAVAICEGGATAEAYARAYAESTDVNGLCVTLTQARSFAYARCGPGYSVSSASTSVVTRTFGLCNIDFGPSRIFAPVPSFASALNGYLIQSNVQSAAVAIASAGSSGYGNTRTASAAVALAQASSRGGGSQTAVARSLAVASNRNVGATGATWARTYASAYTGGYLPAVATAQAQAFVSTEGVRFRPRLIDSLAQALYLSARNSLDACAAGIAQSFVQAGRFGRDTPRYYGTAVSSGFAVSYRNRYLPQYRTAVARASAQAAVINTGFAGQSLAAAAAEAYTSNRLSFAQSQAEAFAYATNQFTINDYARGVARAIAIGGRNGWARPVYEEAFYQAIIAGGVRSRGLATAAAVVLCDGGNDAVEFARVLDRALGRNRARGCDLYTDLFGIANQRSCSLTGVFSGGFNRSYNQRCANRNQLCFYIGSRRLCFG